ncbi:ribosomal protein S18 acetylase RimI-like enzyme [Frigoribacterium sp. PhB160]|uniref:GNAT family N-acetyltransferase n=1 Tax=Frigoribacterium sp. PhB160 TaxID=2485192 RepID=UPI000FB935BE|nr:GNAT family N-acetyltransferase [Frigoribacterium sp. PhB160]ROS61228.1 ribosomal protein S18 acetylase RimI-like enzyme [Frigoribacterium sp. PhB160]
MTDTDASLLIRRCRRADVPLLTAWTSADPVAWVGRRALTDELETGAYRPEWSWIAERDGRPVGRALWWGRAGADVPSTLDCLTVSPGVPVPEDVGTALVRAGLDTFGSHGDLEFNVDVAVSWAGDPAAAEAVRWRHEAAHRGGFARTTERISFAWTSSDPMPPRSTRLRFESAPDAFFQAMFADVASGSLDGHTIDMAAREGVEALAEDDLAFYLSLPGDREAWRSARLSDGRTVGFIVPTRTAYDASISYLGVLPGHRGHGYVHDLLAEMVHVHHEDGQPRIVGTTDAANRPMRAAFERAGFSVTRVRLVHSR